MHLKKYRAGGWPPQARPTAAEEAGKDQQKDMETEIVEGLPVVCRLLEPALREREEVLQREVFSAVKETHELADGYALRFPGEADWLATLAEFIRFERACCPFLRFELHAEQQTARCGCGCAGRRGPRSSSPRCWPCQPARPRDRRRRWCREEGRACWNATRTSYGD